MVEQVLEHDAGRDVSRPQERREQHRLLLAEPLAALERRGRAPVLAALDVRRHVVADLVAHPLEEEARRLGAFRRPGDAVGELADRGRVGLDHVGGAESLLRPGIGGRQAHRNSRSRAPVGSTSSRRIRSSSCGRLRGHGQVAVGRGQLEAGRLDHLLGA